MKKFLSALLLASAFLLSFAKAATPAANTATFQVEFVPGPVSGDEFFIEAKQPDGTFIEVAKGPASPIVFTVSGFPLGAYTVRVRTRNAADPANTTSAPSDEAFVLITPDKPGKPTITVTVTTTVTVTK